MALLVKNSTFASKFQTPERAMYYVTLYHQKALHALKGQKLLAQGIALGNHERKPVAL